MGGRVASSSRYHTMIWSVAHLQHAVSLFIGHWAQGWFRIQEFNEVPRDTSLIEATTLCFLLIRMYKFKNEMKKERLVDKRYDEKVIAFCFTFQYMI